MYASAAIDWSAVSELWWLAVLGQGLSRHGCILTCCTVVSLAQHALCCQMSKDMWRVAHSLGKHVWLNFYAAEPGHGAPLSRCHI